MARAKCGNKDTGDWGDEIGEQVINFIVAQGLIAKVDPVPTIDGEINYVMIWQTNACEQLTAFIKENFTPENNHGNRH